MEARRPTVFRVVLALGARLLATELSTVATSTAAGAAGPAPVATTTTMTFVDTSRPTPPWNGMPGNPPRSLVTTI